IGTGVILAPLHHPLRLAEDAATVSLLSGGRFTLGLGLGWSEVEFDRLGARIDQRGRAMEEILTILPKAWTGQPFTHEGRVYGCDEVAVRPAPPEPVPILIGGGAEPAIRRAARLSDGIYSNATTNGFLRQLEWVRDECDRIGRDPSELRIVHYSVILPGDSADDAWARYTEHLWQMTWKYSDMEASATRSGPPPAAPELTEADRGALLRRATIAGSSDEIVDSLLDLRDKAGIAVEFAARSYFPTLDYDSQVELMAHLAEEVAPRI
ncbi:MAG TPA: LLM class flavin-dependent oxidoreductase, partial [Acidimicrobiia bacterium]|nr:LLM class flavin-dependent oxidoreductase [Acidimicrobiia bacterium]